MATLKPRKFQGGSPAPRVLFQQRSLASQFSLRLPRTTLSRLHICSDKDFKGGDLGDGEVGEVGD